MHDVFPFDLAFVAEVGLEFFELGEDVAVVGLVDEFGEEGVADVEEFFAEGGEGFDEGGVEAFEDVGVGFEAEGEEFLEFPVAFLVGDVFELFGDSVEGPVEVGGGEVDSAAVGVGGVGVEAVGTGADDAAVDDVVGEVVLGELVGVGGVGLEVAEGGEVLAFEGGFEAVGEADAVGVEVIGGLGDDDADGADGVEGVAGGGLDFVVRDDLGAEGEDGGVGVGHEGMICGNDE